MDKYGYESYFPYEEQPRKKKLSFRLRPLPHNKPNINLILFLLTIVSTYLTSGPWYSFAIIAILLSHEMGHYLMCRRYGVPATLPFFIPFPFGNPFGTLGAVIQMRGAIPSRRALFDIGAAGPIAGLVVTLPAIYFGVQKSTVLHLSQADSAGIILGESVLFKLIKFLAIGPVPQGYDVMLHPLAYAGWAGLFVTALNLLPIGQLDGGHIVYSILGRFQSRKVTYVFLVSLGVLAIVYPGWALLFALLLIFGRRHPSPQDDATEIGSKRIILGILLMAIFILSFTPMPFRF
ncbi:hypothetical protein A2V82_07035 [candidate division KSB1 bacterium RBG_16_48_16]|nr:MAG: hypothetical protein A2V82_07035 [candidate division KSB1 bacterium RBG_16_48_16]